MSQFNSQITKYPNSPTALRHPGDVPFKRELAEAQAAQCELAHVGARTSAQVAAVAQPDLELRLLVFFRDLCGRGHLKSLVLAERHADELQQLAPFLVGPRRRDDRDVHAARLVD